MKDDDIAPPSSALSPELELFFPSPPRSPPPPPPPPPFNRHPAAARMRRGPMYSAYSELRDSRLRRKREEEEEALLLGPSSFKLARTTPALEKIKTPATAAAKRTMPAVMRSVPNFSAALRKENRDPGFLSPPPAKVGKLQGTPPRPPPATAAAAPSRAGPLRASAGASGSSPSGRNVIKSSGGPPARRSYSCFKELKELRELSGTAAAAIEKEGEGGGVCVGGISKRPPLPPPPRWY